MNDMTYKAGTERVKTWLDGQVLHIRFNNPEKHNALSVDMWEAVPPLLERAAKDDNVRVVVLSGEGGKSFVSGADISQFEDMRAAKEAVKKYEAMAEAALQGIYEFEKPTIACIRGYCIGGGVNVAISCDLRIGLVNRIAEPDKLDELLAEYTTAICQNAPLTIKAGKRIIRDVLKTEDADMDLARKLILDCFESEDYAEGRRAFMEKRKPAFKGK
jgi:enoyl-CoA hydratase/carnithine racemase